MPKQLRYSNNETVKHSAINREYVSFFFLKIRILSVHKCKNYCGENFSMLKRRGWCVFFLRVLTLFVFVSH